MNCWKCGGPLNLTNGKVGFRAVCEACGNDLHVCLGCAHYKPGAIYDCSIPGVDLVKNKEARNFCEEFKAPNAPMHPQAEGKSTAKDSFKNLFKDE